MRWRRRWRRLVKRWRLATLLACLAILIISNSCSHQGAYLTLPKPPMPVAPQLHSQPTPPSPPTGEKGVWFPLADAGALKIYLDKLKGKCIEDNLVIDKGNEYVRR